MMITPGKNDVNITVDDNNENRKLVSSDQSADDIILQNEDNEDLAAMSKPLGNSGLGGG